MSSSFYIISFSWKENFILFKWRKPHQHNKNFIFTTHYVRSANKKKKMFRASTSKFAWFIWLTTYYNLEQLIIFTTYYLVFNDVVVVILKEKNRLQNKEYKVNSSH